MSYQSTRNVRRENRTLIGRFRGGKLAPVMAVPVRGNEGGMLNQSITLELDPIAGRMITPMTGEFISVFVPVQAIDALKDPEAAYAGMTEVIREKLLAGNPLFGLENESEISKRCGVNPRSIGGVKQVNEMVRLGHNAAVNYLRQRKYVKATLLLANSTAITPALISQTVLERMNGVLDPDERINGAVDLQFGSVKLPVRGIGNAAPGSSGTDIYSPTWSGITPEGLYDRRDPVTGAVSARSTVNLVSAVNAQGYPEIWAELDDASAGQVSLLDFYNAETADRLTRQMRQIVDDNPEYGEEMVLRWAHGLSVDTGKTPFVIAERREMFGRNILPATDKAGVEADTMRSDMLLQMQFSVPVPRTELGGIIITFATLDLSRICAAPSARLSHFSFEGLGAFPAQC